MIDGLITLYTILAVYLLSIILLYVLCRYAYVVANWSEEDRIWPTYWIIPVINTTLALGMLIKMWRYFPITGDNYWVKKWDKSRKKRAAKTFDSYLEH